MARRDNSPDDLIFIAYTAEHKGEPTASMEVAGTLVARDLID